MWSSCRLKEQVCVLGSTFFTETFPNSSPNRQKMDGCTPYLLCLQNASQTKAHLHSQTITIKIQPKPASTGHWCFPRTHSLFRVSNGKKNCCHSNVVHLFPSKSVPVFISCVKGTGITDLIPLLHFYLQTLSQNFHFIFSFPLKKGFGHLGIRP